jgi:hypothetical protein
MLPFQRTFAVAIVLKNNIIFFSSGFLKYVPEQLCG